MVKPLVEQEALSARPSSDEQVKLLLDAFQRRKAHLRRMLEARAGDSADADDLLQDLFVKLAAIKVQEPIADAEAFCFRLAYNLAADRRRSTIRRRRREDVWGVETGTFVGTTPVLSGPPADEAFASRQELKAVLAVVERLPSRSREVFRIHKLEGLSYAETARRLAISVSAVEKHMMRALAAISRQVHR